MSNKHQMLRNIHVHHPTSSQEDLFILPNVPNHFFFIKFCTTGWAKNCDKSLHTRKKIFFLIFENVIELYLVIPSNLFFKGSFWTFPCKWKKCLIITQPSSNINNSELVWKLLFDPDTPNITKIKSKTIRIGRRTQKIIVHHEKSRDKSNNIYLAQLFMVIALEN